MDAGPQNCGGTLALAPLACPNDLEGVAQRVVHHCPNVEREVVPRESRDRSLTPGGPQRSSQLRLPPQVLQGTCKFTTNGSANPTATIIALALRLSDHLKQQLR